MQSEQFRQSDLKDYIQSSHLMGQWGHFDAFGGEDIFKRVAFYPELGEGFIKSKIDNIKPLK
jgi:hypothetical protein